MKNNLSLDRIEGKIAVFLTNDGEEFLLPKNLLNIQAKPGDIFTIILRKDIKATNDNKKKTEEIQSQLESTDTGENIHL
jgi:hypothetical protein